MGKINLLSNEVFNRIAAGEVVEKPASIVKELIENSIDAGSSSIIVKIFSGGKHIIVTDNGCGMDFDDLKLAILPHATSKIAGLSDLDSIKTLGFRGEALPSIAAVSKLSIISRTKEMVTAGRIVVDNGKLIDEGECGGAYGTTVEVQNLFEKIPARLKFLKKATTEENDITNIVEKLILANYNVAIKLFINDKSIRESTGKGLNEAVFAVYGNKFLLENEYVNATHQDITLYGYVNKPAYSKHNRNYQTLIVNGRYVINSDISFWIYNAFSSFLMKRQYPAYVLYLNIPYDLVDINVHPSKIEVKFIDMNLIRKIINSAIYGSLQKTSAEPTEIHLTPLISSDSNNTEENNILNPTISRREAPDNLIAPSPTFANRLDFAKLFDAETGEIIDNKIPENKVSPDSSSSSSKSNITDSLQNDYYIDLLTFDYRGKLFNTYLIFEKDDYFIMIDQHAAHERILYDKYTKAIENNSVASQELMFPFVFDLDYSECEIMDKILDDMNNIGFDIVKLSGNSYSISAVPLVLYDFEPDKFISLLIKTLDKGSVNKLSFIKESIMQASCKAAIKGDMDISEADIKSLILEISNNKIDLFCPHGRPIAIKINKSEVEKWFKRIV